MCPVLRCGYARETDREFAAQTRQKSSIFEDFLCKNRSEKIKDFFYKLFCEKFRYA